MRLVLLLTLSATVLLTYGCSTVEKRIERNQSLYSTYPPEVQNAIREGKIYVGFSKEQVAIALGQPHESYTKRTATGETRVWEYYRYTPATTLNETFDYVYHPAAGFQPVSMGNYNTTWDRELRLEIHFQGDYVDSIYAADDYTDRADIR